jgi:retron-type reverse transcriptase
MLRHRAVTQEQGYIAEGYSYVVDVDLETFFDRVNHDSRMARVAARVSDKRALELTVPAFLNAGRWRAADPSGGRPSGRDRHGPVSDRRPHEANALQSLFELSDHFR